MATAVPFLGNADYRNIMASIAPTLGFKGITSDNLAKNYKDLNNLNTLNPQYVQSMFWLRNAQKQNPGNDMSWALTDEAQPHMGNVIGMMDDKTQHAAFKGLVDDPNRTNDNYDQLAGNLGKMRFAASNRGALQTLNDFRNNPLMFILNNLFSGDPSKLYSVIKSMNQMYGTAENGLPDTNNPWYKYIGSQTPQYAGYLPWFNLLGHIRSAFPGGEGYGG
jgi:hypothetical protein